MKGTQQPHGCRGRNICVFVNFCKFVHIRLSFCICFCCLFAPENKLSCGKALSNSMVAVSKVVPTLKDPRDAHHYEQLAVEDLGGKLFMD